MTFVVPRNALSFDAVMKVIMCFHYGRTTGISVWGSGDVSEPTERSIEVRREMETISRHGVIRT